MSQSFEVLERRRRRRANTIDYIEVKHVHHPKTGQLLGVFLAKEVPADPEKLIAFARRKARAAKAALDRSPTFPAQAAWNNNGVTTGNPDGWDPLRNQDFWLNVQDHKFWHDLLVDFEKMPSGMNADVSGIHDPFRPGSCTLAGPQLSRDTLTKLAWRAITKLRGYGMQSSSDPVDAWLDLLKSHATLSRPVLTAALDQEGNLLQTETRSTNCIRTVSVALCSMIETQALKNDLLVEQGHLHAPPPTTCGGMSGKNQPQVIAQTSALSRSVLRRQRKNREIEGVRVRARQMLVDGSTHQEVCQRLKDEVRPPRAEWRHLPWDKAYLDEHYRGSVAKWLSKNCRP